MFVAQPPASLAKANLAPLRAAEFGATIYPTVAEALRCGGDTLAVDAVLIVGEHGEYPSNCFGASPARVVPLASAAAQTSAR